MNAVSHSMHRASPKDVSGAGELPALSGVGKEDGVPVPDPASTIAVTAFADLSLGAGDT